MFGRGKITARMEEIERKLAAPAPLPLPDMFGDYHEPSSPEERRAWLGGAVSFYESTFRDVLRNQINLTHANLAQAPHTEVDLLRGHLSALYAIDSWFVGCQGELESLIIT